MVPISENEALVSEFEQIDHSSFFSGWGAWGHCAYIILLYQYTGAMKQLG
jgi:hypothetical protein